MEYSEPTSSENNMTCDYGSKKVTIGKTNFKLFQYRRIMLKPRSETIVQVSTNQNKTGIIKPGVYIGCCLVKPNEFICPASILNTTEEEIEIQAPQVDIEELLREEASEESINKIEDETIPKVSREKQINDLLRISHLNKEEKKTLLNICE